MIKVLQEIREWLENTRKDVNLCIVQNSSLQQSAGIKCVVQSVSAVLLEVKQ